MDTFSVYAGCFSREHALQTSQVCCEQPLTWLHNHLIGAMNYCVTTIDAEEMWTFLLPHPRWPYGKSALKKAFFLNMSDFDEKSEAMMYTYAMYWLGLIQNCFFALDCI